jgi:tetratricopeptide (TPR) repeat protein
MARTPTLPLSVLVTAALLTVSGPAAGQGQGAPDAERLFARAIELHQAGDILGAIDSYKAVLAIAPDRADALSNLGAAYVRLGQYDDAVAQYALALKADPANASIRLNLALAYYKSARPQLAIPELRRVVASEPEARNAYLVLAECYLQMGQDSEVVALLKPRAQLFGNGNDPAYAYLLGTALLHQNEIIEGQKYVNVVFGAGESAEAHLLMGMAYLTQQDFRGAKAELERAVKLNPQLLTAHSLYGRSLLALGEPEAAEREFRRELELNVNDFEANLQMGHIRRGAQRLDDASVYLERANSIRPGDLTARQLLANLRLQSGKTDEAVVMLEAIIKDAPELIEAHVQLATAYGRLKRTADAQREREIIERLTAEAQARQPGAKPAGKGGGAR